MSATSSTASLRLGGRRRLTSTTAHVTGIALVLVPSGMALSGLVGWFDAGPDRGTDVWACMASAVLSGAVGVALWMTSRLPQRQLPSVAFRAVTVSWIAVSVAGALPFLFSGLIDWAHIDDALFESISGFTCTGSTILDDIDSAPSGVMFFRQLTQWFGGMGLIVLAVAVMPTLKVGGLELIAAEAPGPAPDRLTPRVQETAKRLWMLYAGLTAAIALALMVFARMGLYDALAHAFTAAATGGFSNHQASVAYFDSAMVEAILVVGMLVAGANFTLHWQALNGDWKVYSRVSEFRIYVGLFVGAVVLATALNVDLGASLVHTFRDATFNVASLMTSTGFGTVDFTLWGPASQVLLMLLMIPCAMTGSTSGGMKVLRLEVMAKYAIREISRARHPRAISPLRLGPVVVGEDIVARTMGFVLLYLTATLVGGALVTAAGTDPVSGFSAAITAAGGIGPGLGDAGPAHTFLDLPRLGRPVLMFLMLFGRLEVFPVIISIGAVLGMSRRATARVAGR